jgi:XTP/dITP diphosphohydrolase
MRKLVLATSNRGKLDELRPLLADAGFDLLPQAELGVGDAVEDGHTFLENALLKARHASAATGLPALADDSGLVVDALGGEPGLYSARYAGVHGDSAANTARLLARMQGLSGEQRRAHFYCVLVLLRHARDPQPLVAEGVWPGSVLEAPRGEGGFGYDPVFFVPAHGVSAAELEPHLKHRISHRGRALARLRERLAEL